MTDSLPAIDRHAATRKRLSASDLQAVVYKKSKNEFSEYFIDSTIYRLKNVKKLQNDAITPPLKILAELEAKCKPEHIDLSVELALLCFKQNERFADERRLFRLHSKVNEIATSKEVFGYFIHLLALIFMRKEDTFEMNTRLCEVVETWIQKHLQSFSEIDFKITFSAVFAVYGMHCGQVKAKEQGFSVKFLKTFGTTLVWHEVGFWKKVVEYCHECLKRRARLFYPYFLDGNDRPRKLRDPVSVYELCLNLCVTLLRLPLERTLDILNHVNERKELIKIDQMQKISYDFEAKWIEVQKTRYASVSERVMAVASENRSLIVVLKLSLPYIGYGEPLIRVLQINRLTAQKLKSAVLKQLLLLESIDDEQRIKIWLQLAAIHCPPATDTISASAIRAIDSKVASIIKMDVRRTNFAKFYAPQLESILLDLAHRYPLINYYQGMNCIGGYLLNYLDDPVKAEAVFSLLIKKRLSEFFGNNFEQLKKLIYISERILRLFLPRLCDHLENLQIGNVLYVSPFLLTIFTSFLQYYQNYSLVNRLMDLFVALGWLGFFKVLVHLFGCFEERLLGKNYDSILIFLNKKVYEYMFQMKQEGLKAACLRVPVTAGMVHRFGIDFDKSRRIIESYWSNYFDRTRGESANGSESHARAAREASSKGSGRDLFELNFEPKGR